jgi:hypothetical protein
MRSPSDGGGDHGGGQPEHPPALVGEQAHLLAQPIGESHDSQDGPSAPAVSPAARSR